jgi:hypothetical protein
MYADEVHALGDSSEEEAAGSDLGSHDFDSAFLDPLSEESLREYLRRDDLASERSLTMRVDAASLPLELIGERLPNLRELKLSGSRIPCVRDLGTSLRHVQVLWLSRCGLRDLAGIAALVSLKELYAAFNDICDLGPLADLESLELVDLETNGLTQLSQLEYLGCCSALTSITLEGNALTQETGYHATLARLLPRLQYLDDMPFDAHSATPADSGAAGQSEQPSGGVDAALGLSPPAVQRPGGELDDEIRLVRAGIKHARLGIDDSLYEDDRNLVSQLPHDASDPYRPRTALMSSTCSSWPGADQLARPTTAAAGAAMFQRPRPGSARPGSARYRPGSARLFTGGRPVSARLGGRRPQSHQSSIGDGGRQQQRHRSLGGAGGEGGHDGGGGGGAHLGSGELLREHLQGGSELTFGTSEAVCGNLTKALRQRRAAQRARDGEASEVDADGEFVARSPPRAELDMLEELKAWKLETAQTVAGGFRDNGAGLSDTQSSVWSDAATIVCRPNSDGTQANVLRLDGDGDAGDRGYGHTYSHHHGGDGMTGLESEPEPEAIATGGGREVLGAPVGACGLSELQESVLQRLERRMQQHQHPELDLQQAGPRAGSSAEQQEEEKETVAAAAQPPPPPAAAAAMRGSTGLSDSSAASSISAAVSPSTSPDHPPSAVSTSSDASDGNDEHAPSRRASRFASKLRRSVAASPRDCV